MILRHCLASTSDFILRVYLCVGDGRFRNKIDGRKITKQDLYAIRMYSYLRERASQQKMTFLFPLTLNLRLQWWFKVCTLKKKKIDPYIFLKNFSHSYKPAIYGSLSCKVRTFQLKPPFILSLQEKAHYTQPNASN